MKHRGISTIVGPVADSTASAVHRRDHVHGDGPVCHPHAIEVIGLGHSAMVVCHDCGTDTGFMDVRKAEVVATRHRTITT
jgi:hypothetical protein